MELSTFHVARRIRHFFTTISLKTKKTVTTTRDICQ